MAAKRDNAMPKEKLFTTAYSNKRGCLVKIIDAELVDGEWVYTCVAEEFKTKSGDLCHFTT